ncbi:uncharacterized protein LOC128796344 [Vidua chalybeata]|uniref:uncharacterized protein LOC128796344 n=1 Tax=Vidua chalybeata TaxID=81927 RepID=UPI0023A90139|nr:uncharacterized protein LOC128796344 [Vidua chalybeata]
MAEPPPLPPERPPLTAATNDKAAPRVDGQPRAPIRERIRLEGGADWRLSCLCPPPTRLVAVVTGRRLQLNGEGRGGGPELRRAEGECRGFWEALRHATWRSQSPLSAFWSLPEESCVGSSLGAGFMCQRRVSLQSHPTFQQINTCPNLGVISKLTNEGLNPLIRGISEGIGQSWPQRRALRASTGISDPSELPGLWDVIKDHQTPALPSQAGWECRKSQ